MNLRSVDSNDTGGWDGTIKAINLDSNGAVNVTWTLIDIGAYKPGANQRLDDAVMRMPAIDAFARQDVEDLTSLTDTLEMLQMVATAGGVG